MNGYSTARTWIGMDSFMGECRSLTVFIPLQRGEDRGGEKRK